MKVRLLVGILGTRDGKDWPPRGDTIDLPDGEAQTMIANGQAEDAKKPPKQPVRLRYAHEMSWATDGEVH